MAHVQKPDFVFPRNGRVHLNRWERQFSRLQAAEVCASALVMLDIPRSEVAWEYWLPTPFTSFPFTSPPVRHRVPPGSARAIPSVVSERLYCLKDVSLLAQFTPLFVSSKQMGFTDLPKSSVILRELSLARFMGCPSQHFCYIVLASTIERFCLCYPVVQ